MDWNILRVSIPVFDLEKSINFYNFLLNNVCLNSKQEDCGDEYFISGGNCELRLYKLKNNIETDSNNQSRRTYPSLLVKNLNNIIAILNQNNVKFQKSYFTKKPLISSILIQETSLNMIELIDLNHFVKTKVSIKESRWRLHHINLESYDVRSTVNFIAFYLHLNEGSWKVPKELGNVNVEKNQLAIFPIDKNHGGIHVNKADFTFSIRNNFIHNPTIGGHPAFNIKDINKFISKLKKFNIPYTDAKIYAMPKIHQVYVYDPSANIVEVNQIVT